VTQYYLHQKFIQQRGMLYVAWTGGRWNFLRVCFIFLYMTYILYSASWLIVEHLRERQKCSVSFCTAVEQI